MKIVSRISAIKKSQLTQLTASRLKSLTASNFTAEKNQIRLIDNDLLIGLGEPEGQKGSRHDSYRNSVLTRQMAGKVINYYREHVIGEAKSNFTLNFDTATFPSSARSVSEGANLASYSFDKKNYANLLPVDTRSKLLFTTDYGITEDWKRGEISANAQNIARKLTELPSNLLTPAMFVEHAEKLLKDDPKISIQSFDKDWILDQKMNLFHAVGKGSAEPMKFLEIKYTGTTDNVSPIALVGKGVTFDTGGISIKPSAQMDLMKGDMGGAAVVLSTIWAISQLNLPVNVVASIPLCENMPAGNAVKPGDVVIGRNGLSVEIDNTDAEGRLILADAIHYTATTHSPSTLIELSTLTGAVDVALGSKYAGLYTSTQELYEKLQIAGLEAGDLFWRLPMVGKGFGGIEGSGGYLDDMKSDVADLKNAGSRAAGSCTAAIFLREFVPDVFIDESDSMQVDFQEKERGKIHFAHIDIAGVMHTAGGNDVVSKGMTGRPTRSIIRYFENLAK